MDYSSIYQRLVLSPDTEGYVEKHHIIPRCMGGSNAPDNLVPLSYTKHRLAHLLLVKIHPGNRDLILAAWLMTHAVDGKMISRRVGESLRKKFVELMSGDNHHMKTDELRKRMAEATRDYLSKYPNLHPMKRPEVRKMYSDKMKGDRNPMKNPISVANQSASMKKFYTDNPDKILMNDPDHRNKLNDRLRKWYKDNPGVNAGKNNSMYGRGGELSPVFGRRIINNGTTERRIIRSEPLPEGWMEGRVKRVR